MNSSSVTGVIVLSLGLGLLSLGCITEGDVGEEDTIAEEVVEVESTVTPTEIVSIDKSDSIEKIEFKNADVSQTPGDGAVSPDESNETQSLVRSVGGTSNVTYPSFFCPFGCNSVNCQSYQCVNVGFMSCSCQPW